MASTLSSRLIIASLSAALLAAPGCATFSEDFSALFSTTPQLDLPQDIPSEIPTATVMMKAEGEEAVTANYPLHQTAYIQGVLEKTGLNDRFRRMEVELYRQMESGTHRLEIRYDRANRRVDPRYDYALQAGDRLVVTEDTSNVVDDMLESLGLPF